MYVAVVVLLLVIVPAGCVLAEKFVLHSAADTFALVGKWFVFWPVGVRLFLTGLAQTFKPGLTAQDIFEIKDPAALAIVREVGFGNLAMGALGLLTLAYPAWLVPAAIAGGLYYGLAGIGHMMRPQRNAKEQTALLTDLFIFAVLAVFVVASLLR